MSEEKPKPFSIRLNRCTEADYKLYEMGTQPKKQIYTPRQEFEHLKAFKGCADIRISKQRTIISQIKRDKFKIGHKRQKAMIQALAEHDLRLLSKLDEELRHRTAELRRKIHEETINSSRLSPDDKSWGFSIVS